MNEIKMKWLTMKDPVVTLESYTMDDTTALTADDGGGPPEILSVNLSQYGIRPMDADHFFIPDYSESEGRPEALENCGLAVRVGENPVTFGPFGTTAWQMKLNPNHTFTFIDRRKK